MSKSHRIRLFLATLLIQDIGCEIFKSLMAHSHCTGTGQRPGPGPGPGWVQ